MLFNLGINFPAEVGSWDIESPARALDLSLRAKIRRSFGALQALDDVNIVKAPNRLGISLRPYEFGDPLRTISKNQFVRSNELWTRTDFSPGREKVLLLFHGYPNMEYKSKTSPANKGQVALAVAGLIECMHRSLGHSWEWHFTNSFSLENLLIAAMKKRVLFHYLYIVTDLFFDTSSKEAAIRTLFEELLDISCAKTRVLVVRDPAESPFESELSGKSSQLFPFVNKDETMSKIFYSGELYRENLRESYNLLDYLMQKMQWKSQLFTGNSLLDATIESLFSMMNVQARRM